MERPKLGLIAVSGLRVYNERLITGTRASGTWTWLWCRRPASIGASAAVGLIAAVLSIRDRVVHPTINYEDPDPACDLDYVPNRARGLDVDVSLVNAFAFGGHCVSLLVARLAGA
jgi:hypothetical protein